MLDSTDERKLERLVAEIGVEAAITALTSAKRQDEERRALAAADAAFLAQVPDIRHFVGTILAAAEVGSTKVGTMKLEDAYHKLFVVRDLASRWELRRLLRGQLQHLTDDLPIADAAQKLYDRANTPENEDAFHARYPHLRLASRVLAAAYAIHLHDDMVAVDLFEAFDHTQQCDVCREAFTRRMR